MIEAAFYAASRLFGLSFTERFDLKLYHPDVRAWDGDGTRRRAECALSSAIISRGRRSAAAPG